jgi:gliding motility-associated protein GldM
MKKLLILPLFTCATMLSAQTNNDVPRNIIRDFYYLESTLVQSGINIDQHNNLLIVALENSMKEQPEKTRPYYDKARVAHEATGSFVKFVDDLMTEFSYSTGGREEDGQLIGARDMSTHTYKLFEEGSGAELQTRMNKLRVMLASLLDSADKRNFKTSLYPEGDRETGETWVEATFKMTPLATAMALLARIQNDARLTENEVLKSLLKNATITPGSFSGIEARVIPRSTYVMLGNEYEADILLAHYDRNATFPVYVNGQKIQVENGVARYTTRPSSEGEIKYKGEIRVQQSTGQLKSYKFEESYFAFKPAATIMATKMNVLYTGIDNPLSVSVPGVRSENVTVRATAGSIKEVPGRKGSFIITLPVGIRETEIIASAKIYGKAIPMGAMKYRVRPLPVPSISFGNISTSTPNMQHIRTAHIVYAYYTEGIPYEGIEYKVLRFSFMHIPAKGNSTTLKVEGSIIDAEVNKLIEKIKPGDQVLIHSVEASGPLGSMKLPSSLLFTIK